MSRWTPSHSVLLSMLLDDVIGTQEIIEMRQDGGRMIDCRHSAIAGYKCYFTGSKPEGLDLPGSDKDFMYDMNLRFSKEIKVVEHEPSIQDSQSKYLFVMVTDNIHPGFTMLRSITPTIDKFLVDSCQDVNGSQFLSSYLTVFNYLTMHKCKCISPGNLRIQGPSIEHTDSEQDLVNSIHCSFWPSASSEWVCRTRPNGWPSKELINKIVDFGFHLVPVGYPLSSMNLMEWRISFSVAERYLIWSFNHVQMQVYAVLKLILKEFIKVNCSAENYVLCSYFIKTFLFWMFEGTDKHFWKIENFRECLQYLLTEFNTILRLGTLKHYFITSFNLLEVKLTQHAQRELLQLWDSVIQHDIKIIEQCCTLKEVWREFENRTKNSLIQQNCVSPKNCEFSDLSKKHFIKNTKGMLKRLGKVNAYVELHICEEFMVSFASYPDPVNEQFVSLIVKGFCLLYIARRKKGLPESNKNLYSLLRLYDTCSPDIATGKLWTALLFLLKSDYIMALRSINNLLSSIPPYALYHRHCQQDVTKDDFSKDVETLYTDMFMNSKLDISQIARRAWLFNFHLSEQALSVMPWYRSRQISPFTLAYYLQFLCYHGLQQYDNRDRALRQFVEVVDNSDQCSCNCIRPAEYELVGHCLWFVGERVRAKEIIRKVNEIARQRD